MTQMAWSPCSKGTWCSGSTPTVRSRTTLPNQHTTARLGMSRRAGWMLGLMTASGLGSNSSRGIVTPSAAHGLADLDDALLGPVGVGALLDEQRRAVLGRLALSAGGIGAGDGRLGAVLVDELGPLDECGDHLALRDDGDVATLDEQVPALVAGGDAEVGLARLARAVDDAAHDGHLQRELAVAEGAHRPVGDVDDVDLRPAARRAGDEVDVLSLPKAEGFQELPPGAGLFHRVGRERVADRVADALEQQR